MTIRNAAETDIDNRDGITRIATAALFMTILVTGCASTDTRDSETFGAGDVSYVEGGAGSTSQSAAETAAQAEAEAARAEAERAQKEAEELKQKATEQEAELAAAREEAARLEEEATARAEAEASREANSQMTEQDDPRVTGSNVSGDDEIYKPSENSFYFDYDSYEVRAEYAYQLRKHVAYMEANPELTARLEGNCDARGGREYNLALGSRRAEAVKQALNSLGIDISRLEAISYGKEKPIAFGTDEESYQLNRRVDIVYK